MNIMKVGRKMHHTTTDRKTERKEKVQASLSLCNAHIPYPSQPTNPIMLTQSCGIMLQPVSLDVRLEPKGAHEVYIGGVNVYLHVYVC